jgi:hypothetical protein
VGGLGGPTSITSAADAYYVVRSGSRLSGGELRGHAADLPPAHMLPTTLTEIDAIPLTANGKADLAALPEPAGPARPASPEGTRGEGTPDGPDGVVDPADPVATAVLALWSRLLNTEVGRQDNFFELGGNSLLVVRLLRELPDHGLPGIATRDFYRNSVAERFIQLVRDSRDPVREAAPRNP